MVRLCKNTLYYIWKDPSILFLSLTQSLPCLTPIYRIFKGWHDSRTWFSDSLNIEEGITVVDTCCTSVGVWYIFYMNRRLTLKCSCFIVALYIIKMESHVPPHYILSQKWSLLTLKFFLRCLILNNDPCPHKTHLKKIIILI